MYIKMCILFTTDQILLHHCFEGKLRNNVCYVPVKYIITLAHYLFGKLVSKIFGKYVQNV